MSQNETAYNLHRAWRLKPLPEKKMLSISWPCKVCCWAANQIEKNINKSEMNTIKSEKNKINHKILPNKSKKKKNLSSNMHI